MAWSRSRRAVRGEDGFTLIELMAAITILAIGILGVVATLNGTRDAVTVSEARETAVHRAERELERLRALPYADLALTTLPAPSTDPADPAFYVQSPGDRYQWDPASAARVSDLVTGGTVVPRTTWTDGRLSGTLQVYITRYDDPVTGGTPEARRVIVGVTIDGRASPGRPTRLSTVVHQPPPAP